jgi:hypothetical protein
MNTDQVLEQMLGPARELDQTYAADEARLSAELQAVKAERAKLAKVLRVLDPGTPRLGRPPARAAMGEGRNPESYTISEERLAVVGAVVAQHEDEFSNAEIAKEMGVHADVTRRAFHWMRERGQIRQVRLGGRTGQTRYYVATDKGRVELARDLAEANGTGSK